MESSIRSAKETGSALIAVFWLLAILTMALLTTVMLVSSDVEMIVGQKQAFLASQMAERGLSIGANPQVEPYDPILRFEERGEGYEVHIRGEAGRLNINHALQGEDQTMLEEIFEAWGLDTNEAGTLIDSLKDWVDEDENESLNGAEAEYYEDRGFETYPFNRSFYDLEEMALVRGMDVISEIRPDWRNYFTIWSGSGRVDVNDASPELLAWVSGAFEEDALSVIERRVGEDGIEDTEDDYVFQDVTEAMALLGVTGDRAPIVQQRLSTGDTVTRIESTGFVNDYRKTIVLILRNRSTRPEILSREEIIQS